MICTGLPGCFEFRVSAYSDTWIEHKSSKVPSTDINSRVNQLSEMLEDQSLVNTLSTMKQDLVDKSYEFRHQSTDIGATMKEKVCSSQTPEDSTQSMHLNELKNIFCVNSHSHRKVTTGSGSDSGVSISTVDVPCWSCGDPLNDTAAAINASEMSRCLTEDEGLFGPNISTDLSTYEKASLAALQRGVCTRWLESFTDMHNCWNWPTWRVVENIIKPATAHSRLRYVHLPGITSAAKVGTVDVFISHSWGGIWGDLIAAAMSCHVDDRSGDSDKEIKTVRVYVDVFAVRQWPGNVNDIVFAGVVKHCRTFMVVVSSGELERIGELNFKLLLEEGHKVILPNEKRGIPFLRIWCLAEIASACTQRIPLVIACGRHSIDPYGKYRHIFESNMPLLYHMQFLVSVELAVAQFEEDRVRVLGELQAGIGCDEVNRMVRGSIVGALTATKSSVFRYATVGITRPLTTLLGQYQSNDSSSSSKLTQVLCAASASGHQEIYKSLVNTSQKLLKTKDSDGMSPLMHAIRGCHLEIVSQILTDSDTADVNAHNNYNWSSLGIAAQTGNAEIISCLLEKGAKVNSELDGGHIAIGIGCQNQFSTDCCKLLLDAGSNCNHRDGVGYTILRHAVTPGKDPRLIHLLLDCGADPNLFDNWGCSIMFWALDGTNPLECIRALVEHNYKARKITTRKVEMLNSGKKITSPLNLENIVIPIDPVDLSILDVGSNKTCMDKAIEMKNDELIEYLAYQGVMTLANQCSKSRCCGKLLVSAVDAIMNHFNISSEEAGLAIYAHNGHIDNVLQFSSLPKPYLKVSMTNMLKQENQWHHGIVMRGPDWDYGDEVDGQVSSENIIRIGYIERINRECVADKKVWIYWPFSSLPDKKYYHRVGANEKFDLVYAPYIYIQ